MTYKDNPLLALMPKMKEFGGRNLPIPIVYGNPQGRSRNFQRAQIRGAATSTQVTDFLLTRAKDYSIATIDNETLEASKGNANAFMEAATTEIDGTINQLTRSLAIAMYRSGFGEIGQIGAVSSATITLANIQDVTNFEVGQELDLSTAVDGSLKAYGTSGNGLIITGVNRDTGVLTFGANVTDATDGIPTAAANDFIFIRGDHVASTLTKVAGLGAWVPATAPGSTLFFGVDRSVDPTRLGGIRVSGASLPIEEALIRGAARVGREGFGLDHYFMSFEKYEDLQKSLGSKVQYVDLQASARIGFRAIEVQGPRGSIKCVPDMNCPNNLIYGIKLDMWKLYSLGEPVRVIDTDGLQMLRQASADGVEVRYGYYANMASRAPGANCVISF